MYINQELSYIVYMIDYCILFLFSLDQPSTHNIQSMYHNFFLKIAFETNIILNFEKKLLKT